MLLQKKSKTAVIRQMKAKYLLQKKNRTAEIQQVKARQMQTTRTIAKITQWVLIVIVIMVMY